MPQLGDLTEIEESETVNLDVPSGENYENSHPTSDSSPTPTHDSPAPEGKILNVENYLHYTLFL